MPSNTELAEQLAQVKAELADLKNALTKMFDHNSLPLETRTVWFELTRSWRPVVKSPVSEPLPPEKGEAQTNLETIEALQKVFEGK